MKKKAGHEEMSLNQLIGANIKRIRKEKGWKMVEVTKVLDIHMGTVSNIEQGKVACKLIHLKRLSEIWDTPVGDFFPTVSIKKFSRKKVRIPEDGC